MTICHAQLCQSHRKTLGINARKSNKQKGILTSHSINK
uniref:Uncharacterized protein n=1 Tax=Anguilla anguilla TaxID=7936 RepID=A0A0E9UK68_ANGAN